MKKLLFILTAGCTMALVSCEEWLDKYPLAQMSPETFFSNENELQAFSNKFYTAFPSDGLYNEYWDNIIHNDLPQEMRGGRTIPASGGGWTWTNLRDINTLLEYSGNCKDTDVRNRYDALARFFRVYFYFEKIKRFGDVPWYSKPIGSADPELKRPRDSREYVMQRMIEDIDFAILYLPTKHDLYRITKWTALALKSRFCLFEGTFRKYHGIDTEEKTGNTTSIWRRRRPKSSSPTAATDSTPRAARRPPTATCSCRKTRSSLRSSSPAITTRG